MAISEAQSAMDTHHTHSSQKRLPWDERDRPREPPPLRARRRSLCTPPGAATDAIVAGLAATLNYPGWKPNLRSHSVHGPFITLEQMYKGLPEPAPIHVEMSTYRRTSPYTLDRTSRHKKLGSLTMSNRIPYDPRSRRLPNGPLRPRNKPLRRHLPLLHFRPCRKPSPHPHIFQSRSVHAPRREAVYLPGLLP